jgi:glycosyltransferase involved in cell wall biosynthesis
MAHISIIIPTYNRSDFVQKAVESVYRQTYQDFTLIIVDDGSTDTTHTSLAAVLKKDAHYIYQDHAGVSAARNTGIRASDAEWLAFLDSDDYWLPQKLAQQVAFHRHNPEYLISQTYERWIRHGKRVNQMKKHTKFAGMIYEKCLPLCLITPSSVMIHRSVFDDVGLFDETLPACEDYDLWLRVAYKYQIGLIEKELIVKHGGHSDQLSRSIPTLDKYRIHALRNILASGVLTSQQQKATIKELIQKCRVYGNGCIKRGKNAEGQTYLALIDELRRS